MNALTALRTARAKRLRLHFLAAPSRDTKPQAPLPWCPVCKTLHVAPDSPCLAAAQGCPDCEAPAGRLCFWWCPRYADVLYEWGD